MINDRLNWWLEHNITTLCQAGFRSNYTIEHQLIRLTQKIKMDSKWTMTRLVIWKKSYYKVWRQGLFISIRDASINSNMHRLTNNFPADSRTTASHTEGVTSTKECLKEGISQSSSFSSTLFPLYIVKYLPDTHADGSVLVSAGKLKVATNWDGNAHLDGKAYQLVASNAEVNVYVILLNSMPFYNYSVRGERTPHSLQQPRRDVTSDVSYIHHAAALGYKNAGRQTSRHGHIRDSSCSRACHQSVHISRHRIREAPVPAWRLRDCGVTGRRILRNCSWSTRD